MAKRRCNPYGKMTNALFYDLWDLQAQRAASRKSYMSAPDKNVFSLTVLSFNILCRRLLDEKLFYVALVHFAQSACRLHLKCSEVYLAFLSLYGSF